MNSVDWMDFLHNYLSPITTAKDIESFFANPKRLLTRSNISLFRRGKTRLFVASLLMKAQDYLERIAVPEVLLRFTEMNKMNLDVFEKTLEALRKAVEIILQFFREFLRAVKSNRVAADYPGFAFISSYVRRTTAVLLSKAENPSLDEVIQQYYEMKLHQLETSLERQRKPIPTRSADLVEGENKIDRSFVSPALNFLLLQSRNEEVLTSVVYAALHKFVHGLVDKSAGSENWSEVVPRSEHYLSEVILRFLSLYDDESLLRKWKSRLEAYLYQIIGKLRIQQLFDISVDYPSSRPAMKDIETCLSVGESHLYSTFIEEFSRQIHRRLLQAGAATKDIIEHFLRTAKMLSEIDPTGLLLDGMTESYKDYLRERPDTMKCIVLIFTDTQNESCVLEEFSKDLQESSDSQDQDVDEVCLRQINDMLTGNPDTKLQKSLTAVGDSISTLVGIYSTKECFVQEYQKMLSEQLMVKSDYCCQREYRVLELLKKRFGEAPLHKCEVMLHDIMESKRLNKNIQEETRAVLQKEANDKMDSESVVNLSACMLSHMFWPEAKEPQINLPAEVQHALDVYGTQFYNRRCPRKLIWRTGAGIVDLEVIIGEKKRNYRVSPIHASVLMLFNSEEQLKEEVMAEMLGISVPALKAKVSYWIKNGILQESHQNGEIVYFRRTEMERPEMVTYDDTDDDLQEQEATDDAAYKDLQFFKRYILGFLEGRPQGGSLDQIHRHLSRFIMQHRYDMTESQLARCLSRLIEKKDIKLVNGTYLLP